jgi:hypothetical protein
MAGEKLAEVIKEAASGDGASSWWTRASRGRGTCPKLILNLLSRRALRKLSDSLLFFVKATLNESPLMIGQIGLQKLFVSFYVRSMSKQK